MTKNYFRGRGPSGILYCGHYCGYSAPNVLGTEEPLILCNQNGHTITADYYWILCLLKNLSSQKPFLDHAASPMVKIMNLKNNSWSDPGIASSSGVVLQLFDSKITSCRKPGLKCSFLMSNLSYVEVQDEVWAQDHPVFSCSFWVFNFLIWKQLHIANLT